MSFCSSGWVVDIWVLSLEGEAFSWEEQQMEDDIWRAEQQKDDYHVEFNIQENISHL